MQSSFDYAKNVPLKLQKETVAGKLFQGKIERQIVCTICGNVAKIEENFLDLSLVSSIQWNSVANFCFRIWSVTWKE